MAKLVIRHDLHLLSEAEAKQYLRDVSEFLEIDPDLNAFDLIWMPNPGGDGKTLCVYARRGTCELLRAKHEITLDDQNETVTNGSYVVRVKGHDRTGRKEIALGSRNLDGLKGRDQDDAIMTASTRALQRLTMQFTGLGILSESEVVALANQAVVTPNPAAGASLAGSPMVIPPTPSVGVNNAPGKPVGASEMLPVSQDPRTQAQVATIIAIREVEKLKEQTPIPEAAIKAAISKPETPASPSESTTSPGQESGEKSGEKPARKPRKSKNTVSLGVDVEPERVSSPGVAPDANAAATPLLCLDCKKPLSEHQLINSARVCDNKVEQAKNPFGEKPASVPSSVPLSVAMTYQPGGPTPTSADIPVSQPTQTPAIQGAIQPVSDLPTAEQMGNYRTVVATYTKELPPSKDGTYGCTQRMRAFITKWNNGTIPQQMNVKQWDEMIAWFQQFVEKNGIKGLITYIGDFLGDNK